MDFDKTLIELETICKQLETDLPLNESIELYNQGAIKIKECLNSLEASKGAIYKIKEELDKLVETKM